MPPDPLGAALPGPLCGSTTLSQPGYAPAVYNKQVVMLYIECVRIRVMSPGMGAICHKGKSTGYQRNLTTWPRQPDSLLTTGNMWGQCGWNCKRFQMT